MNLCTARNGTYVCNRPAGHPGQHENYAPLVNSGNYRIGTRIARFTDNYSAVKFATRLS